MTVLDVIVVDDQTIFRDMLVEILEGDRRYRVVGRFTAGREAIAGAATLRPQLAIVDVVLPDIEGIEVAQALREMRPAPRVVVVTAHGRAAVVQRAFEAGVQGIVVKSAPLSQLRTCVDEVSRGGIYYCQETKAVLHAIGAGLAPKPVELSKREREVLRLVASGLGTKEIASTLGLRPKTVSNHRARLAEKLDIHDIAGLTRFAIEQGLIDVA